MYIFYNRHIILLHNLFPKQIYFVSVFRNFFFFFASEIQKVNLSSLWFVRGPHGNIYFSLTFGLGKIQACINQLGVSS